MSDIGPKPALHGLAKSLQPCMTSAATLARARNGERTNSVNPPAAFSHQRRRPDKSSIAFDPGNYA
jgi:hypothetical protein